MESVTPRRKGPLLVPRGGVVSTVSGGQVLDSLWVEWSVGEPSDFGHAS